jgi:DNA-binding CsgD family transcriptional regulator
MNSFQEMLKNNKGSHHFKKMSQLASFLDDRFGINHFWYYKIHVTGYYSYVGTHQEWDEYCYDTLCVKDFTCLRHPECLQKGVNFMRATKDKDYQKTLDLAWEKFGVNFNLNLVNLTPEGVEAFGFATRFNDIQAEERLLQQLPTLHKITKDFKTDHPEFFHHMTDRLVHLPTEVHKYFERPKTLIIPFESDEKVNLTEFKEILSLTAREKDVLKLIARGYPTDFMAAKLNVGIKTVENYLSVIKCKLSCESITDLIKKALYIEKTNYFDF